MGTLTIFSYKYGTKHWRLWGRATWKGKKKQVDMVEWPSAGASNGFRERKHIPQLGGVYMERHQDRALHAHRGLDRRRGNALGPQPGALRGEASSTWHRQSAQLHAMGETAALDTAADSAIPITRLTSFLPLNASRMRLAPPTWIFASHILSNRLSSQTYVHGHGRGIVITFHTAQDS